MLVPPVMAVTLSICAATPRPRALPWVQCQPLLNPQARPLLYIAMLGVLQYDCGATLKAHVVFGVSRGHLHMRASGMVFFPPQATQWV